MTRGAIIEYLNQLLQFEGWENFIPQKGVENVRLLQWTISSLDELVMGGM